MDLQNVKHAFHELRKIFYIFEEGMVEVLTKVK